MEEMEDPQEVLTVLEKLTVTERQLLRDQRITIIAGQFNDSQAQRFIEDVYLMAERSNEPITIILASGGGDVEAGLACIKAIRNIQRQEIKVIGEVHGYAMSMAFLLLQHCNERIMGEPCVLMAHGLSSLQHIGDWKNLEAERKLLDHWHKYFARVIANRCTLNDDPIYKTEEFWYAILQDATPQFYTSSESLEMGLIDRVD